LVGKERSWEMNLYIVNSIVFSDSIFFNSSSKLKRRESIKKVRKKKRKCKILPNGKREGKIENAYWKNGQKILVINILYRKLIIKMSGKWGSFELVRKPQVPSSYPIDPTTLSTTVRSLPQRISKGELRRCYVTLRKKKNLLYRTFIFFSANSISRYI
jgi:hypothetical protein